MTTEYLASEDEANALGPLYGGYIPREASALFLDKSNGLKFTDMKVYLYILHNVNIRERRTHKLDTQRIADLTGVSRSHVYAALKKLCKVGILHPAGSPFVYHLPLDAAARAKTGVRTNEGRERRIQKAVDKQIQTMQAVGVRVTATVKQKIEEHVRAQHNGHRGE